MLNIASILKFIKKGLVSGAERYVVVDDEHVLDTDTGVKLHIYDDWFKLTHNDEVIATMRDFDTTVEQPIIWDIKRLITPPELIEKREESYMDDIKERREQFSNRFEYPEPVKGTNIEMEVDAEEYTG
tara:strand:+ start:571 stop:954 length:384 start_codon:yes stop_codon:yes gene_type:complete